MTIFIILSLIAIVGPAWAKDTLVVSQNTEAKTLHPLASYMVTESAVFQNIYDTLVDRAPTGELIPALAESWDLDEFTGQGVLEVPVAFQTAAALSVIDTFEKKYPNRFINGIEDIPGNVGKILGTVVEINDVPVSVLALVNATEGGIGPIEDLEGNVMMGDKGRGMKKIGLGTVPTIILECKAFVPKICDTLDQEILWIRANGEIDNRIVFDSLVRGAEDANRPCRQNIDAYPRGKNEMAMATQKLGERIAELGHSLSRSRTAAEKVNVIAELSVLISQDAGGVSFMTNDLHDRVGGGGIMPGTSAVLSMLTSRSNIDF